MTRAIPHGRKSQTTQSGDEALPREIRDRYKYALDTWEEIRKERRTDLRYICGDPWETEHRRYVVWCDGAEKGGPRRAALANIC